jgi:hypothetical protein
VVWRATGQLLPDFIDVDVLVINPETLPSVASWGEGPDLTAARAALKVFDQDAGSTVPAILVGDANLGQVGSGGTVRVGADEQTLSVRDRIATFPGTTKNTVVFDARSLFPALDKRNRNLDPSVEGIVGGQGYYATWLWSTLPPSGLAQSLEESSIAPLTITSLEQAGATPVLASSGWAATYQVVLGVAAVALAGLSLLVTVDRRVARAAAVDLMLRRFGIPPARLLRLRAVELTLTGLGALAVLVIPFALVLALLPRLVEPGPELSPALGVQVPLIPLLLSVVAAAVVTALAALVAARRSSSLKPAEVLRDDQ